MYKNEAISLFHEMHIDDFEVDDLPLDGIAEQELIGSDSRGIHFWFDGGMLHEIERGDTI